MPAEIIDWETQNDCAFSHAEIYRKILPLGDERWRELYIAVGILMDGEFDADIPDLETGMALTAGSGVVTQADHTESHMIGWRSNTAWTRNVGQDQWNGAGEYFFRQKASLTTHGSVLSGGSPGIGTKNYQGTRKQDWGAWMLSVARSAAGPGAATWDVRADFTSATGSGWGSNRRNELMAFETAFNSGDKDQATTTDLGGYAGVPIQLSVNEGVNNPLDTLCIWFDSATPLGDKRLQVGLVGVVIWGQDLSESQCTIVVPSYDSATDNFKCYPVGTIGYPMNGGENWTGPWSV
jgi:hypothetical protein